MRRLIKKNQPCHLFRYPQIFSLSSYGFPLSLPAHHGFSDARIHRLTACRAGLWANAKTPFTSNHNAPGCYYDVLYVTMLRRSIDWSSQGQPFAFDSYSTSLGTCYARYQRPQLSFSNPRVATSSCRVIRYKDSSKFDDDDLDI